MTKRFFSINSLTFILLISLYFTFALNTAFWQFIFQHIEINSTLSSIFALSIPFFMFLPLFILFCIISVPYLGKPIISILIICSAISDYAMNNLGIIINKDMIQNFAETNIREAFDLITYRSITYVGIFGLLPIVLIYFTKIKYYSFGKEILKRLISILVCFLFFICIGLFSYKEYISFARNHRQVRNLVNTFNYISATNRYYKAQRNSQKEFIILDSSPTLNKTTKHPRLVVLVIGETARAQNFSLYGYNRNTNPLLEKQNIITFQNVTSCGTSTAISLPCIFAATARTGFDANKAKHTQNLLDIAQLSGYDILWKENDDGCKNVCNRVATIDAQKFLNSKHCFDDYCHDEFLLEGLDDYINNINKDTIIVLHMMGSHGPTYFKRYPIGFKKFLPSCDTSDLQNCNAEQIKNTYDNTILYTDFILSSVIDILKKHQNLASSMFYGSDHGESLGENNIYLHGLPYAVAPNEQKQIPMILWLSDNLQKDLNINPRCLTSEGNTLEYSHDNLYHSILRLLSINTTTYNSTLDIFTNCIIKQ